MRLLLLLEGIVDLHNHIMFYLVLILVFVLYIFASILLDFFVVFKSPKTTEDLVFREVMLAGNNVTHGTVLEIVWTLTPSFILMLIGSAFIFVVVFYGRNYRSNNYIESDRSSVGIGLMNIRIMRLKSILIAI